MAKKKKAPTLEAELLDLIRRGAKKKGWKPSYFCRMANNNSKLYGRLLAGATVTTATYSSVRAYCADIGVT